MGVVAGPRDGAVERVTFEGKTSDFAAGDGLDHRHLGTRSLSAIVQMEGASSMRGYTMVLPFDLTGNA